MVHISLDLGHDVLGLRETPHQGVHTHNTLKLGGWILWLHQWTNSSRYGFAESVDESSLTSLSCVATWYFKSSILGMATSLSLSHPPKQCNFIYWIHVYYKMFHIRLNRTKHTIFDNIFDWMQMMQQKCADPVCFPMDPVCQSGDGQCCQVSVCPLREFVALAMLHRRMLGSSKMGRVPQNNTIVKGAPFVATFGASNTMVIPKIIPTPS